MNPSPSFLVVKRIPFFQVVRLFLAAWAAGPVGAGEGVGGTDPAVLLAPENLHAWCAVPFDAVGRGPEERAAMLKRLGFKRFVYDWREKDIPAFAAECEAMKQAGIEITGWWSPTNPADPVLRTALEVFKRQKVAPALWVMGSGSLTRTAAEQEQRVAEEAERIRQIVEIARPYGVAVQLYNHNGWFGIPDNEVAVIERLKKLGVTGVGMVYNFSHGHGDMADFAAIWKRMQAYVVAVNVTGMVPDGESKIMAPSQGIYEQGMLRVILESGWRGPVGLIAEQGGDAEVTLGQYRRGLEWLKCELVEPGSGGPRPNLAREAAAGPAAELLVPGKFGPALEARRGGILVPGREAWRAAPLSVEAWVKLENAAAFNVIVASDSKASAAHWELYSYMGAGDFSVYLPGQGGEVRSGVAICDGAWHHVAMVLESARVRLYVDGKVVGDKALAARQGAAVPGELGIGRTVEAGIGCAGWVEEVRLSSGVRAISLPTGAGERDGATIELFRGESMAQLGGGGEGDLGPLNRSAHPLYGEAVNRDRQYDFYAKQAREWRAHPQPMMAAYPGLDGGKQGHWGNQNDEVTWRDGRWNDMDCGPCLAGVFRGAGLTVSKAVCVRLGENGERSACYDPVADAWRAVWEGGFLKFSDTRHGFMDGLMMKGNAVEDPLVGATAQNEVKKKYRGYYRYGKKTIFAHEQGGAELLRSADFVGGKVVSEEGEGLRRFAGGGPTQWPQIVETKVQIGLPIEGWPFVVDTLSLPFDNPWKSLFFVGGHDFYANGDVALCTMTGDVWRVSGIDSKLGQLHWKRVAAGLHQPLGLVVAEDLPCVLGRDQITRLHDLNGDGEADFYECLSNDFETPVGGHDFLCGLERDAAGNFYTASGSRGLLRITPGKKAEVVASGFRNPDGLGLSPEGVLTVPYSEGEWTPTSAIAQIVAGGYYGYPGPKAGVATGLPLLWLPRGADNSAGGQTWIPDKVWGPLSGQMVHLSFGTGSAFAVLRQEVKGVWQGGAVPLPGNFRSGSHRGRFSPRDGHLYVSGMTGWGSYTPDDGCLQRLRYTGGAMQVPVAFEVRENGLLLTFSDKLGAGAAEASRHFAQCWNYRYSAAYGSPELSLRQPEQAGHDVLDITRAVVVGEGRQLFLEMPQIQPAGQIHVVVQPQDGVERELFLTAHVLGGPFRDFAGYQAVAKQPRLAVPGAGPAAAQANPWGQGKPGRALRVQTAAGLQFAERELRAKRGERLSVTLANPDVVPHNWVLLAPGSTSKVGEAANKMIADPRGFSKHYVPEVPEVLVYTDMVDPGREFTIYCNAPAEPGNYPYICTFPGHWMVMKGVLVVE